MNARCPPGLGAWSQSLEGEAGLLGLAQNTVPSRKHFRPLLGREASTRQTLVIPRCDSLVLMHREKADIVLIAYHFPPDEAIGAARPYRFYKYLKEAGYRCHVITASPPPGGAQFDVHFVADQVAPLWESPRKSPLGLMALVELLIRKCFIPGGLGIGWSVKAVACCLAILRQNRGRRFVLLSSYPPVGVLLAALLVSLLARVPWIADFRDPLLTLDAGRFPLANCTSAGLRAITFHRAKAIVANTEPMGDLWRETFPKARPKTHVIWNGFDPEDCPRQREIPTRPYRQLVHAGTLYVGRNANLIIESLARLREVQPETRHIRVLLVGSVGPEAGLDSELYCRAEQEGWLEFSAKAVPRLEARRLTESADYLLLLQPQSALQVPGKLFEYLCIGRPIIALVPKRSAVEYVLSNAGVPSVCIHPDDDPAIRDQKLSEILQLSSTPVLVSAWFHDLFDARHQAAQLASIIEAVDPGAATAIKDG